MVAIILLAVAVCAFLALCWTTVRYSPTFDTVWCGGKKWLVVWYDTDKTRIGRDYKKLFVLDSWKR